MPDQSLVPQSDNPILDQLELMGTEVSLDSNNVERNSHLQELLDWCNKFILDSSSWRESSFETNWHLYQRNADSIYDPSLLNRKESWQSRGFVPITASHRESIHAALFRMIISARPPLEMRARIPNEADQADNIRDLILREMEKSRFEVELNKVLDDATTYGSGFCRLRFDERYEERYVKNPEYEKLNILNPANALKAIGGKRKIIGYTGDIQEIQVYRGIKFEQLSIWDIFPDTKSLEIRGSSIAYRFYSTFGEIVDGVKKGYYFPEAIPRLRNAPSSETFSQERSIEMADRATASSQPTRTEYGKRIECYEVFAKLPKKWVYLNGEPIDDPEKLIPVRVMFNSGVILCIEPNDDYDGEPPIYKLDYLPVADQFYGRGIPEMLKAIQEVINETVNQRIDNVALVLNRMFGVIEKAVINREDFVSKPGAFIRLDAKYVTDVRQALMPLEVPDVTLSAYKDVQEMERYAQERTSANRVTLGTSGLVNDANKTLGGLELLRQSAGEKFAYIGMLMEFSFLHEIFRAYWKTIYSNLQPEDVLAAIGPIRAQTFRLMSPEQIEKEYIYEPQGIFTMENKSLTQARLGSLYAQFANEPWLNKMAFFDKESKSSNLDPDSLKLSPEDMQTMMAAQMNIQMAQQPMPKSNGNMGMSSNAVNPGEPKQ